MIEEYLEEEKMRDKRKEWQMKRKQTALCGIFVLVITGVFLMSAVQAFAGISMSIGPSYPSTVQVGQTYDVHLSLLNASTPPEDGGTVSIFTSDVSGINGFSHAPQCGSVTFPCANPDSVFSLSGSNFHCTGSGAPFACCTGLGTGNCTLAEGGSNADCQGFSDPFSCCSGAGTGFCDACSGRLFTISAPDANGVVTFTDGNPIVLTAPGTANAGCTVHFSAHVNSLPTIDATPNTPGVQTDQPSFCGARSSVTSQIVPETGSSIVTVQSLPNVQAVPTMTEWGMIIFMILAGIGSVCYLRKRRT